MMKKLTTVLVAGFLALSATAQAGSKCNGTVVTQCPNSRVHVLTSAPANAAPERDIVDTAVGAGSFKTLVAAVQAAGLVEILKGNGRYTDINKEVKVSRVVVRNANLGTSRKTER